MPGYFTCQHCGKRIHKNPRLKIHQKYCGNKTCQQSRKNLWEREKLRKDPAYRERRKKQKAIWRKDRPGHQYQLEYRQSHPQYVESNRKLQQIRNKSASEIVPENKTQKIVKTDTLMSGSLVRCGLYEILPYKMRPGKKIVKTDAIIVEIRAHHGLQKVLVTESG
jgi:hypothetical protein